MDYRAAVTEQAKLLNEGRSVYEGGADRAEQQDMRRLMMEFLPPGRFLDQDHMTECASGEHGGPNDIYRQSILRRAGAAVSRQLILRPDELQVLADRVGLERP